MKYIHYNTQEKVAKVRPRKFSPFLSGLHNISILLKLDCCVCVCVCVLVCPDCIIVMGEYKPHL